MALPRASVLRQTSIHWLATSNRSPFNPTLLCPTLVTHPLAHNAPKGILIRVAALLQLLDNTLAAVNAMAMYALRHLRGLETTLESWQYGGDT